MIDTSVKYLGLSLKNPIIVGSCGLTSTIESLKKLESNLKQSPSTGTFLGYGLYKIRMANTSKNIGKRGGFRVITYFFFLMQR